MTDIKKLHQLIAEALEEIRTMKEILQGNQPQADNHAKLVDVQYICNDLGISYSHFQKQFMRQMVSSGVLFQLKSNGKYYARIKDYDGWKEDMVKRFQTLKTQL